MDSPEEIARIMQVREDLGLSGGVLVTNPIPEAWSMDADGINAVIHRAVAQAETLGITGKEVTPFLLAKVKEITGGDSLEANIALVLNNAALAARVAGELCR